MRVLVSCYACSPYKGSEPGMGWNFIKCLSSKLELHVIVESKFEEDINRYLESHSEEKIICISILWPRNATKNYENYGLLLITGFIIFGRKKSISWQKTRCPIQLRFDSSIEYGWL